MGFVFFFLVHKLVRQCTTSEKESNQKIQICTFFPDKAGGICLGALLANAKTYQKFLPGEIQLNASKIQVQLLKGQSCEKKPTLICQNEAFKNG